MVKLLLPGKPWEIIEPLPPVPMARRKRNAGRLPIGNGEALSGIIFILKTGMGREDLTKELGCGSGMG